MKSLIRKFLSQKVINSYYHTPKAILANIKHGFPAKKLKIIGVTGTDGKTTTTNMIYEILKNSGKKVSMVSTINAVVAGKEYDTGFHITSPSPFMLQKFAKMALKNEDEYLVLEVTSHSLDQNRFLGIKFDVAVITNITHEHLDYHKTFENYFNTKVKILKNAKSAIVNQNLKDKLKEKTSIKLISFGIDKGDFNQKDLKLDLKVIGDYNIENALAALGVAFCLNIDKKIAQKTLENFINLRGRMNEINNNRGLRIIIDFAHTPNGLENALLALKKNSKGKLIALIGAEGFRDVDKRSMMGMIAQKLSDVVIVTAVDPRGQLDIINEQIKSGLLKQGGKENKSFYIIKDRQSAIDFAINSLAKRGDTVGLFGKGHESSMNLDGKKEINWSDFDAVAKALDG